MTRPDEPSVLVVTNSTCASGLKVYTRFILRGSEMADSAELDLLTGCY